MTEAQSYSLGALEAERARLDAQAARIAVPTAVFLGSAGIAAEQELALDTLQARLAADLQAHRAVGLIPAIAGA